MSSLRKFAFGLGLAVFVLCLTRPIYADRIEVGDAGQTLGTAQDTGSGPLNFISGNLGFSESDIYRIWLQAGLTFTATTENTGTFFDTQLYLFGPDGLGVIGNDDGDFFPPQSTITFSPSASGIYYLAISGFNFDPISISGRIFPQVDFFTVQPWDLRGPTGAGGGDPLSGWAGVSGEAGEYSIALTGASPIPEPATLLLMGAGMLGLAMVRRRR